MFGFAKFCWHSFAELNDCLGLLLFALYSNNNNNNNNNNNGLILMPFQGGRSLTWDVTVVCSTADSYIDLTVQGPGSVAEIAASRKVA